MPMLDSVELAQMDRRGTTVSRPLAIPVSAKQVRATLQLSLTDKLQEDLFCQLDIDRSADGGDTWMHLVGFEWTSYGPKGWTNPKTGEQNQDPCLVFDPGAYVGNLFQIRVTVPDQRLLFAGARIDLLDTIVGVL